MQPQAVVVVAVGTEVAMPWAHTVGIVPQGVVANA